MSTYPTFAYPKLYDAQRWKNQRIGLFGGSFNPPHPGHLHVAKMAQIHFGLNAVWWIVTPQNPLKRKSDIAAYDKRFGAVEVMLKQHPKQIPTHLESLIETKYTYDTVFTLREKFSNTDFIWICGMDNAHIFHKWDRWQEMLDIIPVTFIARPPAHGLIKQCPVRMQAQTPQFYQGYGQDTDLKHPGIYWVQGVKMLDLSSTQIRKDKQ